MSVSSCVEGIDSGDGGVIDNNVTELSRCVVVAVRVPSAPAEKAVVLKREPFPVMLTRDTQSGVTVTSPMASSDVHFRRSSMAEGCGMERKLRHLIIKPCG